MELGPELGAGLALGALVGVPEAAIVGAMLGFVVGIWLGINDGRLELGPWLGFEVGGKLGVLDGLVVAVGPIDIDELGRSDVVGLVLLEAVVGLPLAMVGLVLGIADGVSEIMFSVGTSDGASELGVGVIDGERED